jgi:hypothetical protein
MRDLRLPTSSNWATQAKIGAIQWRTRRDGPGSRSQLAACVVAHVFEVGPESVVLHAIALRRILQAIFAN